MFHGINFEKPNCLGWTIVYSCLRFGMCCEITTELNKFLRWTIIYPRAWYVCFVEFTLKIQIVKGGQLSTLTSDLVCVVKLPQN